MDTSASNNQTDTPRGTTGRAVLACVCFLALVGGYNAWPPVRFTEEVIMIAVHPTHVDVQADYVYENPFPFPLPQGFSVPFPVDDGHPPPIGIRAERLGPGQDSIPLAEVFGTLRFDLYFAAGETVRVRLAYRQYTPTHDARYLLTTTQPWRRPLVSAEYRLYANGVTITHSNYPLEPREDNAVGFERREFMPQADWRFRWETP